MIRTKSPLEQIKEQVKEWEKYAKDAEGLHPLTQNFYRGRADAFRAVLAFIKVLEEENRDDGVLQAFEREDKLRDAQEMQAEMRRDEE